MSAAATIARVARQALNRAGHLRAGVLVVGAAGVGREEERRALRDALRVEDLADRLVVTTDLALALESGLEDGPGIVLLAGTGSVAAARLPDGSEVRQGGYGWLMGDEGSGYAIGREALRLVARAEDGRAPATALRDRLLEATRAAGFADLIRWATAAEVSEVASLAPAVLAAAGADDPGAGRILDEAAEGLVAQVEALLTRFPGGGPVPVVLGGGLLAEPALEARVRARLRNANRAAPREAPLDPLQGAFRIAARDP